MVILGSQHLGEKCSCLLIEPQSQHWPSYGQCNSCLAEKDRLAKKGLNEKSKGSRPFRAIDGQVADAQAAQSNHQPTHLAVRGTIVSPGRNPPFATISSPDLLTPGISVHLLCFQCSRQRCGHVSSLPCSVSDRPFEECIAITPAAHGDSLRLFRL